MNKTVLKKLTEKHYHHTSTLEHEFHGDDMLLGMRQEMKIMEKAASELLQPRPEAITRLLETARSLS